jgi:hypothetical protein
LRSKSKGHLVPEYQIQIIFFLVKRFLVSNRINKNQFGKKHEEVKLKKKQKKKDKNRNYKH